VVRLYLPAETPPQQHSLDQMASAKANGCTVGGYMWCYKDADPRLSVREALALAKQAGVTLPILWLDMEPFTDGTMPDAYWLSQAVDECVLRGVKAGVYTGSWCWNLGTAFKALPLWVAQYSGGPTLDDIQLFGGWTSDMVWGKQYIGEGLDQDVFRREATG
jgi:hypothetical protein